MMIVLKATGQEVQSEALKFRQRVEAFVKFHTTQVVALFFGLASLWGQVPFEIKQGLYDTFPTLGKWRWFIAFVCFCVSFYIAKMSTQVVAVSGPAPDAHQ